MAEGRGMSAQEHQASGYKKPPERTRFQKGTSGNPRGRPRGKNAAVPYDKVLGQMVTIREEGRERRVTAAEAFLLQLTKKGLEGCGQSARTTLAAIEQARTRRDDGNTFTAIQVTIRGFGICCIVEDFGMAVRQHPTNEAKTCLKLKPWIVQAAVDRMSAGQLDPTQQATVIASTQTPEKVHWPDWWTVTK